MRRRSSVSGSRTSDEPALGNYVIAHRQDGSGVVVDRVRDDSDDARSRRPSCPWRGSQGRRAARAASRGCGTAPGRSIVHGWNRKTGSCWTRCRACCLCSYGAVAPSDRHAGDAAALALRTGRPTLDLAETRSIGRRPTTHGGRDPCAGAPARAGEPDLGPPPHPRRTRRSRLPGRRGDGVEHPAPGRYRPGTTQNETDMAAVLPSTGAHDAGV